MGLLEELLADCPWLEAPPEAAGWSEAEIRRYIDSDGAARPGDWLEAAGRLAELMCQMRAEGRPGWLDGMAELMGGPGYAAGSPYAGACSPSYPELALDLQVDLSAVFRGWGERSEAEQALEPLRGCFRALEGVCARVAGGGEWGWMDRVDVARVEQPRPAPGADWRWQQRMVALQSQAAPSAVPAVIKLVSLPLALYVRNTTQLYALLGTMHGLRHWRPDDGGLRERLDTADGPNGRPCAWLLFSILAALQLMSKARHSSTLEPLCCSPPLFLPGRAPVYQPAPALGPGEGSFMYRGVWLPRHIDEHRLAHSTSFASFSRHVRGVRHVLEFYANANGSEHSACAQSHAHVLLLVSRDWHRSPWVFPVEAFNNGCLGGIEQELLVPPFTELQFETSLELRVERGKTDRAELEGRLAQLALPEEAGGWGWAPDKMMTQLLQAQPVIRMEGLSAEARPLELLTVRFIKSLELAAPIEELLLDESSPLYGFDRGSHAEDATA